MQQKSDLPKKKLVTIGDAQTGKTSLLWRITHKQRPNIRDATIGAAFFNSSSKKFCINMWDTAGQERFRSMVPIYLRDAEIILFVYDIADRSSYEHLKKYWINFALTHSSPQIENVKKTPSTNASANTSSNTRTVDNRYNNDYSLPSTEPLRRSHTLPININNDTTAFVSSDRGFGSSPRNSFTATPSTPLRNSTTTPSTPLRNSTTTAASTTPLRNSTTITSFGTTPPLRNSYSQLPPSFGTSPQTPSKLIRSNSTLPSQQSQEKTPNKGRKNESPFCFIIANKSDLDKERTVSTEEGINLAKSINAVFIEISALTGSNVDKIFNIIDSQFENGDTETDTQQNTTNGTTETIILDEQKGVVSKIFSCCSN